MSIQAQAKLENGERFQRAIDRAAAEISDLRIPLGLIAQDYYKSEKAIFLLQSPGQYADLSEVYKVRKQRAVGFTYPILKRRGNLERSLTDPTDSQAIFRIERNTALYIGTRVPYAGFHQRGEGRQKKRPFLFIGPEAGPYANAEQRGRPERWFNILNSFVLAKSGIVGEVAGIQEKK